jgi:hypothetical protein
LVGVHEDDALVEEGVEVMGVEFEGVFEELECTGMIVSFEGTFTLQTSGWR